MHVSSQLNNQQPNQPTIDQFLPSNLRKVDHIYRDTTTNQHYIAAESPGGTTGLIPIEIRGISAMGETLQPISLEALAQPTRQIINGNQ